MEFPEWVHPAIVKRLKGVQRTGVLLATRAKAAKKDERAFDFITSSEAPDRMGDIVRQVWDFGAFKGTGSPFLFGHGHIEGGPSTIGNSISETIVTDNPPKGVTAPFLVQRLQFAPEGVSPLADSAFKLVEAGVMKSTSVGFRPLKVEFIKDEEERKELGLGMFGVIFAKSELMEISLVDVPANPQVQILNSFDEMVKRDGFTDADMEILEAYGQLPLWCKDVWVEVKGKTYSQGIPAEYWEKALMLCNGDEKCATEAVTEGGVVDTERGQLEVEVDLKLNDKDGFREMLEGYKDGIEALITEAVNPNCSCKSIDRDSDSGTVRNFGELRAKLADSIALSIDTLNAILADLDEVEEDSSDDSSDTVGPASKSESGEVDWYENLFDTPDDKTGDLFGE